MTADEYQKLAVRTMNPKLTNHETTMHALFGMVSEVGEVMDIYQKTYQGHEFDQEHVVRELGDLLWFITEYCAVNYITLEEVMQKNIAKLKMRYPMGFAESDSLNRDVDDI